MATAKKKELGVGGIVGLVIAALLLLAILAGVVFYVHSGRAGIGQSAGILTPEESTAISAELATDPAEAGSDAEAAETDAVDAETTNADAADASVPKDKEASSDGAVTYKAKTTAKKLGALYDQDVEAFRNAYQGKTVTVTGKVTDKSAKMLYIELDTGTKVPLRIYTSSEEQRDQFSAFAKGTEITVRGTMSILYPAEVDSGGFQEMANGLIALDTVTLVS